ncbi:MAG: hypothetical protein WCL10_09830 [Novosphingobium sp.]|uniref:calcium-binding protein n=1 Tax=Novosphingobium sp. TaxID=1874826 RepID=UPI003019F605
MSGTTYKKSGSEVLVNQLTEGNQEFADIAALENGNFVVTWQDSGNSIGFGAEIKAQIFDAAGGKVGGEFLVNSALTGDQEKPVVTGLTDGNFVIVWNDTYLYNQIFNSSGQKISDQQSLSKVSKIIPPSASIAKLTGDGFVVNYGILSPTTIEFQHLDGSGAKFSPNSIIGPTSQASLDFRADLAGLNKGGYVAVWNHIDVNASQKAIAQVEAQICDRFGNRVSGPFVVGDFGGSGDNVPTPQVAGLSNGRFVVIWREPTPDAYNPSLSAQVYSASGAKVGSKLVIGTAGLASQSEPHVTALDDGGFVVSYTTGVSGNKNIVLEKFDSSGNHTSEEVVKTTVTGDQFSPTISALEYGGFAVTWTDNSGQGGDSSGTSIKTQIFKSTNVLETQWQEVSNTVAGFSGYDRIVTWDLATRQTQTVSLKISDGGELDLSRQLEGGLRSASVIASDFGNVITTGAGKDTLIGGAGADQLHGGSGADRLYGGGGDVLYGGVGGDQYFPSATDTIIERSGEGIDTVNASSNYELGANLEILQLLGSAAINGTGNAYANRLIGNNADNVLDGKSGTDQMWGNGGNDVYYVDNRNDSVREAAGKGFDTIIASVSYALVSLAADQEIERMQTISPSSTFAINLTGNELGQTLVGNAGRNTLSGLGGNDVLDGGPGSDLLYGGTGDDRFIVDTDLDRVREAVGEGFDTVYATASFRLYSTAEIEVLQVADPAVTADINLTGNNFAQSIYGSKGNNILSGGGGNDYLDGYDGDDTLLGGSGRDTIYIRPTAGQAVIDGGPDRDILQLERTNSDLPFDFTMDAPTTLKTLVDGTTFINTEIIYFAGGKGNDTVTGGIYEDQIAGGKGADILSGGAGADLLGGQQGRDTLTGGSGDDAFYFAFGTVLTAANADTITDFTVGDDQIRLGKSIFTAITGTDALSAAQFRANTTGLAESSSDRIIYDKTTGKLFYDADGKGGADGVLFVTLTGLPELSAADFALV